jgi:hypothetical protein
MVGAATNSSGGSTCPNTLATVMSSDVGYDGDSERIDKKSKHSQEGQKEQSPKKEPKSSIGSLLLNEGTVTIGTATGIVPRNEPANPKLGNIPDNPTPVPVSPFTSSNSSESSTAGTASSSPLRKKSFSAALQVSTMQVSFAEKTSSEMKEIVGWYERTASEERFIKVDQRKSLPNNAMVYDLDEDDEEDDDCEDGGCDNAHVKGNAGPSSGNDGISSPLPMMPRLRDSLHCKPHRTAETREHLEAADHLIRNTQYMADVIAELEHSSSASCNETMELHLMTTPISQERICSDESAKPWSDANDKDSDESNVILQQITEETALLTQTYTSRQKLQQRPSKVQRININVSILMRLVVPILLAIMIRIYWSMKQE